MPIQSTTLFNSFKYKIDTLNKIREKQENLFNKNLIFRRDIEEVYSAIYIDVLVSLEALIEDLFIGLLTGQISSRHIKTKAKINVKTTKIARDIVYHSRNYFNWLPYENTERYAMIFFYKGGPFTLLNKDEKNDLVKCLIIRNAIVHKSNYAVREFNEKILTGLILRPRDKKPSSFLRIQFSINPNLNYYQQYVLKILKIANTIC